MDRDEITPAQRARQACVYVRQSSLHQLRQHPESQRRQRELVERAVALGWPRERITVFDQDLGGTAARSGERASFDEMVRTQPRGSRTTLSRNGRVGPDPWCLAGGSASRRVEFKAY